jgi:hypothetical protein
MSDTDSDKDLDSIGESLGKIHQYVEQLAHTSKHMYSRALRIQQIVDNPEMDLWVERFKMHERTKSWAKRYMVASKCSMWEVHTTMLEAAKKESRILANNQVKLNKLEADIMDLPFDSPVAVWALLARLPRFFI